jgi:pimeloyl-ACP methyl ester carboxylesterase
VLRWLALRDIMRHGELVSPADAVDLGRSALRCTIAQLALGALRADRGLALRDLDRIDRPVLLASPQFDRVLPPERHAPRLRREIPGVQSRVLAGCGHVPMWDDTRLVVSTVCEWVDGHAGGAERGPTSAANFVSPKLTSAPG